MRDRLIELIKQAETKITFYTSDGEPVTEMKRHIVDRAEVKELADYLLANGVVVLDTKIVTPQNRPLITQIAGMPINDVLDLLRAKKEGRLIVPPCKVGQTVYIPVSNTILHTKVFAFGVDEDGNKVINPKTYPEGVFGVSGYEIGKTVFLTKEEAEQTLSEREEK